MKTALIGHTGFVGGNLLLQHPFDDLYNSKNIESIADRAYDLIVCAGLPAEKWKANQNPAADRATMERLMAALRTAQTKQMILISTVDVYPAPIDVDEDSHPDWTQSAPYGRHRRLLEEYVHALFPTLILRLPGLFGAGLKKNMVYDFLYKNQIDKIHADAQFQFYGLTNLWTDIQTAQGANLNCLNVATEPVSVVEAAGAVFGIPFENRPPGQTPARYAVHSKHAALFGGAAPYLQPKMRVLSEMKAFVTAQRRTTL